MNDALRQFIETQIEFEDVETLEKMQRGITNQTIDFKNILEDSLRDRLWEYNKSKEEAKLKEMISDHLAKYYDEDANPADLIGELL